MSRPDQLDQQIALEVNRIRRRTNDIRRLLGIATRPYPIRTAEGEKE